MLAGGLIACKSKYQATVALSSTKAKFTASAEAGKTISHTRAILQELGYKQYQPTTLYIDNQGALHMANAEQPTRRTHRMDAKIFAIQQWVKEEHMALQPITTQNNTAEHFSKALGCAKFHEQTNTLMGRMKP